MSGESQRETMRGQEVSGLSCPSCLSCQKAPLVSHAPHAPHVEKGVTRRFRLLAGPNGSGKTTLKRRLERDYAVNFYDSLNADEIFAEVKGVLKR